MNLFKNRIEEFEKVQELKNLGKQIYIPFPERYGKLVDLVPGIVPGRGYLITGNAGSGKSKLGRDIAINIPIQNYLNDPENAIKPVIFYNGLEESKEEILDILLTKRLAEKYHIYLSTDQLEGYNKNNLSKELLEKLYDCAEELKSVPDLLHIYDTPNTQRFVSVIQHYAKKNGKFYLNGVEYTDDPFIKDRIWELDYVPNNPNELVIVVSDHLSLYHAKNGNKHATLTEFSAQYTRKLMNLKLKYATIIVQQQGSDSEAEQFSNKGQLIVERTYPTLSGLGDNRTTDRDALVVIGIWDPLRYRVTEHMLNMEIYKPVALNGCYRGIFVLKNRKGKINNFPFFMEPIKEEFHHLPEPHAQQYKSFIEASKKYK